MDDTATGGAIPPIVPPDMAVLQCTALDAHSREVNKKPRNYARLSTALDFYGLLFGAGNRPLNSIPVFCNP